MKLKNILSNAFDAIISSYEGKRFWPSLILRLVMALASAVITAVFANTLFSKNNIVNQIFAALFFYFLPVAGPVVFGCYPVEVSVELIATLVAVASLCFGFGSLS